MSWRFILMVIISISWIPILIFFVTNINSKLISQVQITISKPWTLVTRNNVRLSRLYKKYNLLLNLTAFKTNHLSNKTIIYSCTSFCGGWGDRLRGIISAYILALLTDRHFMIDMNYPCDILKVVEPNFVNWTYVKHNKSKNRTRLYINTMPSWQKAYRNNISNMIKSNDFVKVWSSYDDIFISANSDYMTPALHNIYMLNKTQQLLGQMPISQATTQIFVAFLFELLFKPSIAVRNRVDSILINSRHRHLICLHIRIGKNPTNPLDVAFTARENTTKSMIDFVDNYLLNKSSSLIFVTSDSSQAVSDILRHYPNSSMSIVGPILHIDRFDRRSPTICDGFVKVIADFYLLGECQTLLLSTSGFSSWANLRRENPNEELYHYNEKLGKIKKLIN
ncbi:unnamed protein product [Rotaria sordida]|uniref:Uncharacterized protein n=3 Tax=Rotaria sordida TaxID=392033 RepID=A0A815GE00_9BILA|nr:unnamed protein product [Rotaria sordida]CAF4169682.1 unnamed protein product [Rotaria sordida]